MKDKIASDRRGNVAEKQLGHRLAQFATPATSPEFLYVTPISLVCHACHASHTEKKKESENCLNHHCFEWNEAAL